jgi:hypothetical protein
MARPPKKMITAAIFRLDAGLELRVSNGNDPMLPDTDVSDDAEALAWRANADIHEAFRLLGCA